MTRTLEIPAELENALQEKARQLGIPMERYAIEVLRHEAQPNGASAPDEHRQRVYALRGKYKKSGSMVDELLRDRRDEVARDEAHI